MFEEPDKQAMVVPWGKFYKELYLKSFADAYLKHKVLYMPPPKKTQKDLKEQRKMALDSLKREFSITGSRTKMSAICRRFCEVFGRKMAKSGELAPAWAQKVATVLAQSGSDALSSNQTAKVQALAAALAARGWRERTASPARGPLRPAWSAMQELVQRKLAVLGERGDRVAALGPAAMTPSDWLVADLLLVHGNRGTNVLVDGDAVRLLDRLQPLIELFHLTQEHGLEEQCARRELARRWAVALAAYETNGRSASLVMLQRRWFEIKWQARVRVLRAWLGKRVEAARQPHALHVAIVKRYPHTVTQPMLTWTQLVDAGLVFTEQDLPKKRPPPSSPDGQCSDHEDDLILVERHIETIELPDDEQSDADDEDNLVIDERAGSPPRRRPASILQELEALDPSTLQVTVLFDSDDDDVPPGRELDAPVKREPDAHLAEETLPKRPRLDVESSFRSRIQFADDAVAQPGGASETAHGALTIDRKLLMEVRVCVERMDWAALGAPPAGSDGSASSVSSDSEEDVALERLRRRRRVAKRVELPDIDEVRRVNRNILTAQVAPLRPRSPQETTEGKSAAGRNGSGRETLPTAGQLAELLDRLTAERGAERRQAHCCLARRHRVMNDARRRAAERSGRAGAARDLHLHRHHEPCACCCLHLLRQDSQRALAAAQHRLDGLVGDTLARCPLVQPPAKRTTIFNRVQSLVDSATDSVAAPAPSPPARRRPRALGDKRSRRASPPSPAPGPAASALAPVLLPGKVYDYEEWTRQRNTFAKYFDFGAGCAAPLEQKPKRKPQKPSKSHSQPQPQSKSQPVKKLVVLVPHVPRPGTAPRAGPCVAVGPPDAPDAGDPAELYRATAAAVQIPLQLPEDQWEEEIAFDHEQTVLNETITAGEVKLSADTMKGVAFPQPVVVWGGPAPSALPSNSLQEPPAQDRENHKNPKVPIILSQSSKLWAAAPGGPIGPGGLVGPCEPVGPGGPGDSAVTPQRDHRAAALRLGTGYRLAAEYVRGRDPTELRALCCEAGRALWTLAGQYAVVVTAPYEHRLRRPEYYTFEPLASAARLVFPPAGAAAEGAAPDALSAGNKRYRKLCDRPLRYAQVYCALPSAAEARRLLLERQALLLLCAATARLYPVHTHHAPRQGLLGLQCERVQPLQDLVKLFGLLSTKTAVLSPAGPPARGARRVQADVNKRASIALLVRRLRDDALPVHEIHSDDDAPAADSATPDAAMGFAVENNAVSTADDALEPNEEIIKDSTADIAMESSKEIIGDSIADIAVGSTQEITENSTVDHVIESDEENTVVFTTDIAVKSTDEIIEHSAPDNIMKSLFSSADIAVESTENITEDSTADDIIQSTERITEDSTADAAIESAEEIAEDSTAKNVMEDSTAETAEESTKEIIEDSTADNVNESTEEITVVPTADIAVYSQGEDAERDAAEDVVEITGGDVSEPRSAEENVARGPAGTARRPASGALATTPPRPPAGPSSAEPAL